MIDLPIPAGRYSRHELSRRYLKGIRQRSKLSRTSRSTPRPESSWRGLRDECRKTICPLTHDVEEALYRADRVHLMTPRPGSISDVLSVPLERPRCYEQIVTSPEFASLKRSLLEGLKQRPVRD